MATSDLLICSPLYGETCQEILQSMRAAKSEGAHLVELTLETPQFSPESLEIIIKSKLLPIVVAFRLNPSGGPDEKKKCFEALELALELGAEYVDVNLEVAAEFTGSAPSRKQCSSKVIVSCHINGDTPAKEELGNLVAQLQSSGGDIVKVITDASNITDIARIFHLHSHCQVPLIACATGDRGLISQLLCPKFGGFLVYGSTSGKPIPGVPPLASLTQVYRIENINVDTKVFGLIANPVGHSKGPILHNPSFRHAGYNGIYVPMLVDDINEFFRVYSYPDFAGFSVGIPHKEAAVGVCDEVHPLAKSIGAVNTIVRRAGDGKLIGYNTDCEAAITAMEDSLRARKGAGGEASNVSPLAGKLFVLVGAGGAGRALAFGAKSRGARIVIFNRNYERAKALAQAVGGEARPFEEKDSFYPEKGMILANASAVGMQPRTDQTPVAKEALGAYDLVFDSVYTPRNTRLLTEAEEVGAIAVSGVEMFIRQAIGQFNLFTGGEAPEEFMRDIVLTKF